MSSPASLARGAWDLTGSPGITKRMQRWAVSDGEKTLEPHMIHLEAIRHLRREFVPLWSRKVPAHIAVRLRKEFRVLEASDMVDSLINEHQGDRLALPPEVTAARNPRVFRKAVEYYAQVILDGRERSSDRGLGDAFDVPTTNRRWAKQTIKAAEARANEHDTAAPLSPEPLTI